MKIINTIAALTCVGYALHYTEILPASDYEILANRAIASARGMIDKTIKQYGPAVAEAPRPCPPTECKPEVVRTSQDLISAIDSSGLCLFTLHSGAVPEHYAMQLDGAIEGGWDLARFNETGERIWNLERQFNMKAGLTAKDDNLPPRLLKEGAKSGPAKGLTVGLDKMLPEYYKERGWDSAGKPTPETRARLGL